MTTIALLFLIFGLIIPVTYSCSFLVTPATFSPHEIAYANAVQARRGPDTSSSRAINGITFLHNLLHMTGEQTPQPFQDNGVVATYNGELYNYREFGDNLASDGHAVIPAYKKYGTDFPKHFDGEFAVVVVDFEKHLLVISTDTFGTKPVFYAIAEGDQWAVGSYASAVGRLVGDSAKVVHVPPNTILMFELTADNKSVNPEPLTIERVTEFDVKRQYKENTADFVKAFVSAVEKRTRDLRVAPFVGLSSGYDSGAVSCTLDHLNVEHHSYSIVGLENMGVVMERLARSRAKGMLKENVTIAMENEEFAHQQMEVSERSEC